MSQWGSTDSGILRKNRVDENLDDLLVFGYSCKIFRDDEKALYIDKGKHLIPWMGNESLKIDRYDGRGTLSDLKMFEASREGYDTLRWLGLSESQNKLEELCDKERYYSLEINEEEEEMYKEEVAKRQKTNAFAFDYNSSEPVDPSPQEAIPTVPEKEEEDEPYKPSPILDVPVDISIPKTMKEYARIEKTALFVCRQGPQMEILIKAKQADNPQFSFLIVHDPLYKFYRHILAALKNGRYQPQCEKKPEETKEDDSKVEDQGAHYLHPSLVSGSAKLDTPSITQSFPYRPSADCAYSQLVTRIQGAGLAATAQPDPQQQQAALEQQYHQYYYVQQFYEYWRHSVVNSEQGALYAGLPINFRQLDQNMQSYIHQMAWAQFVQQKQMQEVQQQQAQANANNNSYAQIVSNLNKDSVNPYTANVPLLPPVVKEEVVEKTPEEKKVSLVKYDENEVKKPLLSLAAYGSGSEEESEDERDLQEPPKKVEKENYKIPPADVQTVIDKMAEYVIKNGDQFEDIIRQKADPRFLFLDQGHDYHEYYRAKLAKLRVKQEIKEEQTVDYDKQALGKPKKPITPVSFSIKKPKEEPTKEIKSALPVEDSSDEETSPEVVKAAPIKATETSPTSKTAQKIITTPVDVVVTKLPVEEPIIMAIIPSRSKSRSKSPIPPVKLGKSRSRTPPTIKNGSSPKGKPELRLKKKPLPAIDMFDPGEGSDVKNGEDLADDPILEMMQMEEQKKLDDKEADEREKARQLERKRKAAMFLKLKSVEAPPRASRDRSKEPQSPLPKLQSKNSRVSPQSSISSRHGSPDSVIIVRSRSTTREKSTTKDKSPSRGKSRSKSKGNGRSGRRSRSRERRNKKRNKKEDRQRSRSSEREEDRKRRKDKKKKTHKRKHSKSDKKKSKKARRSRSRTSRSRSSSVKSHISINSS
ncbi:splicing factor, suppressor of white-apricot homolog isoform X1 [Euwallacea fornicatus]|uniref:splicing factor, suppressor of white-apricot homolog isoform X1 n=1 Tax=Euwallacea fornicatus TaxID=995702 RepID=UPI00338DA667